MTTAALAVILCSKSIQTVTITVSGATPRQAVAEIAKVTGEKLAVSDESNKNTLVLHFVEAPIEEALAHIARATSSKWTPKGEERELRLDPETVAKEREAEAAERKAAISRQLEEATKGLESADRYIEQAWTTVMRTADFMSGFRQTSAQQAELQALSHQTPAARLMFKVLAVIDADSVANLEPNISVTYSTRPNKLERAFPKVIQTALEEYAKEAKAWSVAVAESFNKVPWKYQEDPRAFGALATEPVSLVLMRIEHDGAGQAYGISLGCFDAGGRCLNRIPYLGIAYGKDVEATPGLLGQTGTSDDAVELFLLHNNFASNVLPNGTPTEQAEQRWQPRLMKCDEVEPLGYACGPMLVQSAKSVNRQLVAALPDDALEWQHGYDSTPMPMLGPERFEALVSQIWKCRITSEGDWLIVLPRNPVRARANYILRRPLAKLLSAMKRDGKITFDSMRSYATEQTGEAAFYVADYRMAEMFTTLHGNIDQASSLNRHSQQIFRLLGAMSDSQIELALTESGVLLSSLGSHAKDIGADSVYGVQSIGMLYSTARPPATSLTYRLEDPNWIDTWPTAALPNGLPPESRIKLTIEESGMVAFKAKPGSPWRFPLSDTIERSGMWIVAGPSDYDFGKLQVQPRQLLHVELLFGTHRMRGDVQIVPGIDEGAWTTPEGYDGPLKSALEKSIKDWRARYGGGTQH